MGYVEGQDAPRLADEAAVAQGVAQAYAATATTQAEAARFWLENGAAVVSHAPVGQAGRQGDPDTAADASDRG